MKLSLLIDFLSYKIEIWFLKCEICFILDFFEVNLNLFHKNNWIYFPLWTVSNLGSFFLRRLVVMSELTLRPPMGFPNTDRPLLQMDHQEYKWNLWKKSEIQIVFQNQCVTRFSTLGKPHSFAFDCIYISVFQYNWQKNWQSSL